MVVELYQTKVLFRNNSYLFLAVASISCYIIGQAVVTFAHAMHAVRAISEFDGAMIDEKVVSIRQWYDAGPAPP